MHFFKNLNTCIYGSTRIYASFVATLLPDNSVIIKVVRTAINYNAIISFIQHLITNPIFGTILDRACFNADE